LLFGLLGPITAEYLSDIVSRFGSDEILVIVPEAKPVDGLKQYLGNAHQIGLLVAIAVTASALAFDANEDMAVFLRTRTRSIRLLVLTRSAAYVVALATVFGLGALAAWYETAVLIGTLPASAVIVGIALAIGYYGFVVALVALAAGLARNALAVTALAFGAAVGEQVLWGLVPALERWLPARLAFALVDLVEENEPVDYLPTVAVTVVLSGAAYATAIRLLERREV
jgi:ABC-2 type transport system permease protein